MKTFSTAMLILLLLCASFAGWRSYADPGTYVVGGQYVVHAGEVLRGNLQTFFAQVTVEAGARVEGSITIVSSTLDLAGSVSGSVLSMGSDLTVRPGAAIDEGTRQLQGIPYVILLPSMVRSGHAARAS